MIRRGSERFAVNGQVEQHFRHIGIGVGSYSFKVFAAVLIIF
jgi:hypothetical protein